MFSLISYSEQKADVTVSIISLCGIILNTKQREVILNVFSQ